MADEETDQAAIEAEKRRQAALLLQQEQQKRSYFPGGSRPLDPAFQPGAIAAATAPQPLKTATRPGEGALDIVPIGTPLMTVKGVQDAAGQTRYVPLQPRADTFHDLAGQAIDARSAQIAARKSQIYTQLQSANKFQAGRLAAELRGLEHDENLALRDRHYTALENAKNLETQFKFEKEQATADQFANLVKGARNISDNDPDRDAKIGQLISDNKRGAMTVGGREIIGALFNKPPPAAEQIEAVAEQFKNAGMKLTGGAISAKGQVLPKFISEAQAAANTPVMKKAARDLAGVGLTPEEFATRTNVRRGKIDPSAKEFTNQYTGAEKGDSIAVEIGGKTYPMSVAAYERLNKAIPSTQIDPRIALARKALDDPNASEAHKAAARKLLGQ
jgi:hypothetical protein